MVTTDDPLRDAARRMLERGADPEEVRAFVRRAKAREQANAQDQQAATELSPAMKGAALLDRFASGATFGVPQLLTDLAYSAGDRTFKELRAERAERNRQLGGLGLAADLAGGFATGSAVTKALGKVPQLAKLGTGWRAAAEGVGQGAVQGGVESTDGSGVKRTLGGAALGGALGGVLGGTAGAVAGKVGETFASRKIAKELAARGVNIEEARVIAKQLPSLDHEAVNAALARVDEMVQAGRGKEVMAADVLGGEGHNALRAATNISGEADDIARQRIRERDTGIVRRGRNDLGDAAGFAPEQMDAHENALLGTRKAKADESFGLAREQGAAFDAEHPFDPRKKPASEPPADPFAVGEVDPEAAIRPERVPEHALTKEALSDEIVRRKLSELASDNPDKFKGVNPADWGVMHSIYTNINREIGALKKNGNAVGEYYNGLTNAQRKLRASLSARSNEFLPANANFAEYSRGLDAYQLGQDAASQSFPSEARRVAAQADPTQGAELNKGFVDRMAEQLGRGPNEQLGAAARLDNSTRQTLVGSENAAEKIRDRLGPVAYDKLLANAKAEGRMAATSQAGLSNSTTAKQAVGLAGLMNALQEAGSSISANPIWFGTQFARRVATDKMGKLSKGFAQKSAKIIADALTRGDEAQVRAAIEDLAAEMYRQEAAKAAGRKAASITRSAVARAAAPTP